jgi:hypothetical protein
MAAIDDLIKLLEPLPGYDVLSTHMLANALAQSMIPDGAGVWPGQPNYQDTYDIFWAALSLVGYLQAQPYIRQSSSEGTSVAVDAPNWTALTTYFKSQSKIAQATQSGPLLTAVPIPEINLIVRTDMSGVGDQYGDVDTDVS